MDIATFFGSTSSWLPEAHEVVCPQVKEVDRGCCELVFFIVGSHHILINRLELESSALFKDFVYFSVRN